MGMGQRNKNQVILSNRNPSVKLVPYDGSPRRAKAVTFPSATVGRLKHVGVLVPYGGSSVVVDEPMCMKCPA